MPEFLGGKQNNAPMPIQIQNGGKENWRDFSWEKFEKSTFRKLLSFTVCYSSCFKLQETLQNKIVEECCF